MWKLWLLFQRTRPIPDKRTYNWKYSNVFQKRPFLTLFQTNFFEEFCKVIMLIIRMSDAVLLCLISLCLFHALFSVRSNSRYLLVFAKQSWIMNIILRCNIIPSWLNLNSKCCLSSSKIKTRVKMTLSG